jgi:CotS family spore coat protein
MNKELIPSLESAFRCRIYGIKPRRNVFMVKTDRGYWIIKGYKQLEKAEWVTQLAQTLQERGFTHTVQYVSDASGEKIFPFHNRYYTVMKAIDGRESDTSSLYDVKKAAATLARFHLAARGLPVPPFAFDGKPPLLEKWETRLEQFERISWSIEQKGPQNRLEQVILQMGDVIREDARELLRSVYKMPIVSEMHTAIEQGTLAHRDVASHNFLLTPRGSCYLIDLDTVGHDMQLVDLVQFTGRMLLLQRYRLDSFLEAIDAYCKVNYLSDTQIWMIHQLLRYPDNFLREVTGVYTHRPGYHMRGVLQLIQMEGRLWNERKAFLEERATLFQRSPWGQSHCVG